MNSGDEQPRTHLWNAVVRRLKKIIRDAVSNVSAATAHPKPAEPIHYMGLLDQIPQHDRLRFDTYNDIVELSEGIAIMSVSEGMFIPICD